MPARFPNRRQLCALLPLLCLLNAWAGPGRPSPAREANIVDQATAQSDAIELTGRTVPPGNVEIRPRVGGAVLSRNFKDHSEVKAGALLYQINPAPHRANVATATAAVAKAEAALASAKRKARWQQELAGIGVGEPDNTTASLIDAKSKLAAAQLALRNAQASMLATRIVAPAAGLIGASSVDVGTLVSVDGLDPLVTIQPLDPMMGNAEQVPCGRRILALGGLRRCKCSRYLRVSLRFAPCSPSQTEARRLAGTYSASP
jgi:membrane fusion protein (multidrug efflux system)